MKTAYPRYSKRLSSYHVISWASLVAQMVKKNLPGQIPGSGRSQEMWIRSLGQEDPLEKGILTPVFLPGEFHGQRNLEGYSPWDHKESDKTERLTQTWYKNSVCYSDIKNNTLSCFFYHLCVYCLVFCFSLCQKILWGKIWTFPVVAHLIPNISLSGIQRRTPGCIINAGPQRGSTQHPEKTKLDYVLGFFKRQIPMLLSSNHHIIHFLALGSALSQGR